MLQGCYVYQADGGRADVVWQHLCYRAWLTDSESELWWDRDEEEIETVGLKKAWFSPS